MKKLIKNKICGSVNSTRMYCSRKTGQMLRLLFMYRTWTVAASGRKRVKKKKKKKKENAANGNAGNANPNTHYVSNHNLISGSSEKCCNKNKRAKFIFIPKLSKFLFILGILHFTLCPFVLSDSFLSILLGCIDMPKMARYLCPK